MVYQQAKLQRALQEAVCYAGHYTKGGQVASYIPELGKAAPSALEVCVALPDGSLFEASNTGGGTRFTIQSISKVISLILALKTRGVDFVFSRVGMEPTGDPFNSLMKLETASERPFNPLINTGALVTASMIHNEISFEEITAFTRRLCGDPDAGLNDAVYHSENRHSTRNRSLVYLLASKGLVTGDVDQSLDLYLRMCSLQSSAAGLAHMGLVLACGGIDPVSGKRLVEGWIVRHVLTLMMTCGMYDGSGEFAVRVGIPSKSGVGGGIVSCTGQGYGIGVYGPALDSKGNSIGGIRILEHLSFFLNLHCFGKDSDWNF